MDCYVYYKTAQEHEYLVKQKMGIMQQMLKTQLDISARLQRQAQTTDGLLTWMEIYRNIPVAFDVTLANLVDQTDLCSLIHGERHVEYFEDAFSCA